MKKCILFLLLFIVQLSFAQSADKGRINLYLGGGVDLMKRQGNANINLNRQIICYIIIIGDMIFRYSLHLRKTFHILFQNCSKYFQHLITPDK